MINFFFKKHLASFVYFFKELGYKLSLVILLSFSVGLLDGLGLAVFMPLFDLVVNSEMVLDESRTPIHEFINALGISINLTNVLILMVSVFIFKGIMKFLSSSYQVNIFQSFVKNIRLGLIKSFNQINFESFSSADVGRIQNTFTAEVVRVSDACKVYLKAIESLALITTYIVLSFLSNAEFTLLIIVGAVLTNFLYRIINNKTKKQSSVLVKRNSHYHGLVLQHINMFKYLKASGRIQVFADRLKNQILKVEITNKKIGILNALSLSIREPLMILILASVMLIQVLILNGSLELIIFSILFFYRALQTVLSFQNQYNKFLALKGSLLNVQDFQKELSENKEKNGNVKFKKFNDTIRLKNVNFSYGSTSILKDINLIIRKNETIALVGESGSGKSTLINLLSALLSIDSGELTIDHNSIDDLEKKSFQKTIGYITQEPIIFNDTFFNNVTFFDEKNEENLKRFHASIKKSQLFEYFNKLVDKEDTILANNGINISGGQRQRISIAREFYKDSDFLFLDEPTSALDSETENYIQNSLEKMKGEKTIIVAAHRLSTIKYADRIIIMDSGSIHAVGNFKELIKNNTLFKKMVEMQDLEV